MSSKKIARWSFLAGMLSFMYGCGHGGGYVTSLDRTELAQHTATLLSIQKELLDTVKSLDAINDEQGGHYEISCPEGGSIVYEFSESPVRATVTYAQCQTAFPDKNLTHIIKNGSLLVIPADYNVSVTFDGDFNHTLSSTVQTVETIVSDGSTVNFSGTGVNEHTVSTSNIELNCSGSLFQTMDAVHEIRYDEEDNFIIYPVGGKVVTGPNVKAAIEPFHGASAGKTMAMLDNEGTIIFGDLLYRYGNEIEAISVFAPNMFSYDGKEESVSAYLW